MGFQTSWDAGHCSSLVNHKNKERQSKTLCKCKIMGKLQDFNVSMQVV